MITPLACSKATAIRMKFEGGGIEFACVDSCARGRRAWKNTVCLI